MVTDTVIREDEHSRQSGFTLVELLIVIVILGILTAVVVFSVGGLRNSGNRASCLSQVRTVEIALEAFNGRQGTYPSWNAAALPVAGGSTLLTEASADAVLDKLTQDILTGAIPAAASIKLLKEAPDVGLHPSTLNIDSATNATYPGGAATNYEGSWVTLRYTQGSGATGTSATMDIYGWYSDGGDIKPCLPA